MVAPRDPLERELLRQQGDPIAMAGDPGWLKIAGSRGILHHEPLDVDAHWDWMRVRATIGSSAYPVTHYSAITRRVKWPLGPNGCPSLLQP